ncbi:hypothetical protein IAT38_008129 [Cryptococcus sp. DSM 104549]
MSANNSSFYPTIPMGSTDTMLEKQHTAHREGLVHSTSRTTQQDSTFPTATTAPSNFASIADEINLQIEDPAIVSFQRPRDLRFRGTRPQAANTAGQTATTVGTEWEGDALTELPAEASMAHRSTRGTPYQATGDDGFTRTGAGDSAQPGGVGCSDTTGEGQSGYTPTSGVDPAELSNLQSYSPPGNIHSREWGHTEGDVGSPLNQEYDQKRIHQRVLVSYRAPHPVIAQLSDDLRTETELRKRTETLLSRTEDDYDNLLDKHSELNENYQRTKQSLADTFSKLQLARTDLRLARGDAAKRGAEVEGMQAMKSVLLGKIDTLTRDELFRRHVSGGRPEMLD